MLKLTEKKTNCPRHLLAGQRVSRKYRLACIRRSEYRRLKAIVPSIANKRRVSKVKVVEEAIKYIDELHMALLKRAPFLAGRGFAARSGADLSSIALPVEPFDFVTRMFGESPIAAPSSGVSSSSVPPPYKRPLHAASTTGCASLRPLQSSNYVNVSQSS